MSYNLGIAPDKIDFFYKCYPFMYYEGDINDLENGNKIILPNKILNDISNYSNIEYPLHFKINDSNILFTLLDFKHHIENIYIPQHFIENLGIEIGNNIKLTFINEKIKKGVKVILKPHTSNFLEIMDHKHFLENHLTKLYTTLMKGQTIVIPYSNSKLLIDIIDCEPENSISIIDTDLIVDFEAPWDYKEPETEVEVEETFESCRKQFKLGKFNFSNNTKKNKIKKKEEKSFY